MWDAETKTILCGTYENSLNMDFEDLSDWTILKNSFIGGNLNGCDLRGENIRHNEFHDIVFNYCLVSPTFLAENNFIDCIFTYQVPGADWELFNNIYRGK